MGDGPLVLVVDDDPAILATLAEILDLEGYRVEMAANGAAALEVVERSRPAVVLLDMRMPVLDGWGFAEQLRERGLQLPIIALTAAQSPRAWADEIGADACLAKPFELDELLDAVARFTGGIPQS